MHQTIHHDANEAHTTNDANDATPGDGPTADTCDIEQLVTAEIARQTAEDAAKREAQQRAHEAACQERTDELEAFVTSWLDEPLRKALHVTYEPPLWPGQSAAAHLRYHGQWTIRQHYDQFDVLDPELLHSIILLPHVAPDVQRRALWAAFGAYDQKMEQEAEQEAEQAMAYIQRQASLQAAIDAAKAEHEACAHEVDAAIKAAEAAQWHWPQGRHITVYRWTWQRGHDEDGEAIFAHGWSRPTSIIDPLHLQATRHEDARRIHLRDHAHLPVAEERTFASRGDLPKELTQKASITIAGTGYSYSTELERKAYSRTESGSVTIPLDGEPVAWIRELVDAAGSPTHQFDDIPF